MIMIGLVVITVTLASRRNFMSSRPGIENTLSRYGLGYDDHHPEMIIASFTEDAVLTMKIADGDLIGPSRESTPSWN